MPWLLVCTSHTRLYSAITLHRDYYALVKCALVPLIVIEVGWWTSVTHRTLFIPHWTFHMVLLMLPTFYYVIELVFARLIFFFLATMYDFEERRVSRHNVVSSLRLDLRSCFPRHGVDLWAERFSPISLLHDYLRL